MGGLILHFVLLVLTFLPNCIPDNIYKQPRVSKILLKEDFELTPRQKIFSDLVS